ncbi:MAG: signal recognition particle-docking protein FtsY [Methyloligella sp. ZOD6]
MSETKKPGFLKRLFGFGGAEEAPQAPEPEKPAAKAPVAKGPSEKPAAKKPAAKKPTAEKPAAKSSQANKTAAKPSDAKTATAQKPATAKKPAQKKPAAKSPSKPAQKTAKGTGAKQAPAAKPAPKAGKSSSTPPEADGIVTPSKSPRTEEEKRREDKHAAEMQPKTPPPDPAPLTAPGHKPPEEREPSRRTEEAPEADDEAGPASPRPTHPDVAHETEEKKDRTETGAPPAGPGPEPSGDEAEPGPTAPEPKQVKTSEEPAKKQGWFTQLRQGLARTSNALSDNISAVLTKQRLDEDTLDDLEDVLIRADLGVDMAERVRTIIAKNRYDRGASAEAVRQVLGQEVSKVLEPVAKPFPEMAQKPFVWLVVGVNGTGKTTTIGKLAHRFAGKGHKVMLAAADTFRAAAIDQLKIWGDRVDAHVVAHDVGADPAGVAYDGLKRAQESGADMLLVDTAGRLQNKSDLMDELAKIVRVLKKLDEDAPHGVLLVLDATTGQNAVSQVELFQQVAGVTGLVVTKLDGTARGGILVAIAERFGLPVHAIGVGEGIDDLESFDAEDFARAIAGFGRENAKAA